MWVGSTLPSTWVYTQLRDKIILQLCLGAKEQWVYIRKFYVKEARAITYQKLKNPYHLESSIHWVKLLPSTLYTKGFTRYSQRSSLSLSSYKNSEDHWIWKILCNWYECVKERFKAWNYNQKHFDDHTSLRKRRKEKKII